MLILGIETSCDETSAAVVKDGRKIISNVVYSQIALHRKFRGVVPELASRAHVEKINYVVSEALHKAKLVLTDVDAIAVTTGPGLVGSLLVGKITAETLSWVYDVPIIGINHVEAHAYAALLYDHSLKPPFLALIVSGGHTELVLVKNYGKYRFIGRTRDDAAGEAFDKAAKMLGLEYPGGPEIDRLAGRGNPGYVSFPRPWLHGSGDFSFSGLKTSLLYYLRKNPVQASSIKDICASFQAAVVEVLAGKAMETAQKLGVSTIIVGGGVAANSGLRREFQKLAVNLKPRVVFAPLELCTDNAAMIACLGYYKLKYGKKTNSDLKVMPSLKIASWR